MLQHDFSIPACYRFGRRAWGGALVMDRCVTVSRLAGVLRINVLLIRSNVLLIRIIHI